MKILHKAIMGLLLFAAFWPAINAVQCECESFWSLAPQVKPTYSVEVDSCDSIFCPGGTCACRAACNAAAFTDWYGKIMGGGFSSPADREAMWVSELLPLIAASEIPIVIPLVASAYALGAAGAEAVAVDIQANMKVTSCGD